MESVSIVISLIAVLISAGSLYLSYLQRKKEDSFTSHEIALLRAQLEQTNKDLLSNKQAFVDAKLFNDGKGYKVRIFNSGKSDAKNIRIEVEPNGQQFVTASLIGNLCPYEVLHPKKSFNIPAIAALGGPRKQAIKIYWDDDTGGDRLNNTVISY